MRDSRPALQDRPGRQPVSRHIAREPLTADMIPDPVGLLAEGMGFSLLPLSYAGLAGPRALI